MINQRDINRRAEQFVKAGERETLKPPSVISMPGKVAVRGIEIRRAKLTASAGSGNTITANPYINGILYDGVSGDPCHWPYVTPEITVHCNIAGGGTNLNEAVPRLVEGDEILVVLLPYCNAGTIEDRWYCLTLFQNSIDCEC